MKGLTSGIEEEEAGRGEVVYVGWSKRDGW